MNSNNTYNLIVRKIFNTKNNYSQVSIDKDTFNAVRGFSPIIQPTGTSHDANGNGVRIFDINGVTLYSQYNKELKKTTFTMETKQAIPLLQSVEQERASEPGLPFAW